MKEEMSNVLVMRVCLDAVEEEQRTGIYIRC